MLRREPLGWSDYALFGQAIIAMSLAKLVVALASFRWIARSASWVRAVPAGADAPLQVGQSVVLAVKRASRRLPWRSVCLHEGLAAQWMMRMRGIQSLLHYGVRRDEDRLTAHVWVTLDGRILIGEEEAGNHAEVAIFPANG